MAEQKSEISKLLDEMAGGDPAAVDRLLPLVYEDFRAMAANFLKTESSGHTLQPTALVHEAYLKLVGQTTPWAGRSHFIAFAAMTMRRILVDHARGKSRLKRGGKETTRIELHEDLGFATRDMVDVLDVDTALQKLHALDERQARVVELKVFGGLTSEEIAAALGVSLRTIEGEWSMARAWLRRELTQKPRA